MRNVINETMKSSEVASKLSIETVTLRKYSLALEKVGYTFLRNDGKNRDYTSNDLAALAELKHLIEKAGMGREAAAKVVAVNRVPSVSTNDTENDTDNEEITTPSVSVTVPEPHEINDYSNMERYFEQQNIVLRNVQEVAGVVASIQEIATGLQEQVASLQKENQQLKEKSRDKNITDFITIRKVENRLEREAELLWSKQPERMRLIKKWYHNIGLGAPEENINEKAKFISNFISKNLEKALKQNLNP